MLSSQLLLFTVSGKTLVTNCHDRSDRLSRPINLRHLDGYFSVIDVALAFHEISLQISQSRNLIG